MPGDTRQAEAQIRYAHNGGVALGYQVVGHGSTDLVYVPDWVSNLVYAWEHPRITCQRIAGSESRSQSMTVTGLFSQHGHPSA